MGRHHAADSVDGRPGTPLKSSVFRRCGARRHRRQRPDAGPACGGPPAGPAGHRLAALRPPDATAQYPAVRRIPAPAEGRRRACGTLDPARAAVASTAARPHPAVGSRGRRRHGDPARPRHRAERFLPQEPGAPDLRGRAADPTPPRSARLPPRLPHHRGDRGPGLHRLHRPPAALQHPADQHLDPGQPAAARLQRPRYCHRGVSNAAVRPADGTAQRLPYQPDPDGDLRRHPQRPARAGRHHPARQRGAHQRRALDLRPARLHGTSSAAASPARRPPGSSPKPACRSCCTRCGPCAGPRRTRPTGWPSSSAPTPSAPTTCTRTTPSACCTRRCAGRLARHGAGDRASCRPAARWRSTATAFRLGPGGSRRIPWSRSSAARSPACRRGLGLVIVATGPLTSPALAEAIRAATGEDALAFFDAIAPIVHKRLASTRRRLVPVALRQGRARAAARRRLHQLPDGRGAVRGLHRRAARGREDRASRSGRSTPYFEGCLPIEVMAERGPRDAALRADEAGRPHRSAHRPA
jgi:hypothetical protein